MPQRLIRSFGYEYLPYYEMVFPHDPKQMHSYPPRGGWFGFAADSKGFVDREELTPTARENFDYCCLMKPGWFVESKRRQASPGIIQCDCGVKLENWKPGGDVSCRCGRSYNSAGQRLAPRSQWGEETGEDASDYDRGFANPDAAFNED